MASASEYADVLREKKDYARYTDTVADSPVSWHHPVLEDNAAILKSLLFLRAESGITVIVSKAKNTQK
jgi:hypothetical protein